MAENVEVKLGGKSQEEVALTLVNMYSGPGVANPKGDELLDLYRKCLKVVRNPFVD